MEERRDGVRFTPITEATVHHAVNEKLADP
jgi:hypothetical protein